ncbi:MAG TPA: phosphate ABC transporter substrate-binding protein PstS [Candidatus Solibacter sp.]|nr:phosphate ABC transporter substrate-binding protein PstS [Candidatus Solibacter sp.]
MKSDIRAVSCLFLALAAIGLSGCSSQANSTAPAGPVTLKGAGATAPYLAYTKWIDAYKKEAPAVTVQYQATGSGDGLKQLESGAVDFAASDVPLSDEEMARMSVKPLHFPTLIGAIVPVYNLAGIGELKFTGDTLAGVFSGKIKSWNDPALAKANSGVALPASRIVVVHRADASGSTFAFTDFLARVNEPWKSAIGADATVKWPVGEAAAGNEALAALVKKTPNSIGYVELNYAIEQQLAYGAVQNSGGKFRKADLESMGAAIDGVQNMKNDFRASIVNARADAAYPISTLTWLVVPSRFSDAGKLKAMKEFLRWIYGPGQKLAMSTDYGVLQPPLLNYVNDQVGEIQSR